MSKDLFIPRYGEAVAIEKVTSDTRAIIGRDVESGALIRIGDKERCGGLYILGQPRTGKSNLLISIALTDIKNGHGILFIDPHSDAINDLIARIPPERQKDVILLDPTNKKRSFGINLLQCSNLHDPLALDETWGRVQKIFAKVWGNERGELGVWLGKILRNSVYLLLENPGYTLVEIPLLLREDTTFRNNLLANVKVNTEVKDFWYYEFDRLSRREKTEQVGPAMSRLDLFRTAIVREIVGQERSTIDLHEILNGQGAQKIVLLRMPTQLSKDITNLLGTMLLSEVLHAAFERDKLLEKERAFFGVFCDEFQEFATPDFAILFTQQGKFRLMPVVAHQTRLGQFRQGDSNQGATQAAPNKVLFTESPADAKELPLEFAKKPPVEIRLEEQYAISQNPVSDLLRAHRDPDIRAFVNKYLRTLQERLEDVREDMEEARLKRMHFLDKAGIFELEGRMESAETRDY